MVEIHEVISDTEDCYQPLNCHFYNSSKKRLTMLEYLLDFFFQIVGLPVSNDKSLEIH